MKKIGIGIVGLGTVGVSFCRLLEFNSQSYLKSFGVKIHIEVIGVKNTKKSRLINGYQIVEGYNKVIINEKVEIVIELMGGVLDSFTLVKAALSAGKHVITANKALIAVHGAELLRLAEVNNVQLRFEAAVCGGIPVIKMIRESLLANRITNILGIVNGTTNYILTKMTTDNKSFNDALIEAQKAGYAEADPTLDIEVTDAVQKMAILGTLAFRKWISFQDAFWEGIETITPEDINFADISNFLFKLIAIGRLIDGAPSITVFPCLVPKSHPLATVNNEFNAVMIDSDFQGSSVLSGKGAGGNPTASSVGADLADLLSGATMFSGLLSYEGNDSQNSFGTIDLYPFKELSFKYYFHFVTQNRPGIWGVITNILARFQINIESVHQEWRDKDQHSDLYVLVSEVIEKKASAALDAIKESEGIFNNSRFYRILPEY